MAIEKILKEITASRMEIANVCSELIQRPSAHPEGKTVHCVKYIKDYFDTLGISNEIFKKNNDKPNIVAHIKGQSDKTILWVGHLDVVPEGTVENWTYPPYSGTITDDGYVWGRGTSDMKGACAAAMVAAKFLHIFGDTPHNIDFWFTADEEIGGGDGARWLAEENIFRGEVCLIGDGSPGTHEKPALDLGCKGSAGTSLITRGKTAHGSTPHLGDNALDKLLKVIPHVYKIRELSLELPMNLGPIIESTIEYMTEDRFTVNQKKALRHIFYHPSVSLNILKGGVKNNVVPDYAEAYFDIRLTPGSDPMKVKTRIKELVEEAGIPGIEVNIQASPTAGYYESPDIPFAKQLSETIEYVTGKKPIFKILTGGTDAVSIKRFNDIPCLGYGSSIEGQAHVQDEKNTIDILETSCKVYAAFPYFYKPNRGDYS